jgi:hypothetical protein
VKEDFVRAITDRKKIRLTFWSKEDRARLVRTCAPMDYGPLRRYKDPGDRFHLWDYDSDEGSHPLYLASDQVLAIEVLDETFDPAGFVTWDTKETPWHVPRDWGTLS